MDATTPSPRLPGSDSIARVRSRLRAHRLYEGIRTPAALRLFVEHHVVCVLDFMSLLKSLQRELTCVAVPWAPTADPEAARLIQAIVLDEETDRLPDGRISSHFAWYLEAMDEVGADSRPARALAGALATGTSLAAALRASALPPAARAFGASTASFLERPLHARAAAFFHGREEILPGLFLALLERLEAQGLPCTILRAYLQRHIELDGGDHGPQAERLLERLFAGDAVRRAEAEATALESLDARERLWDAIARGVAAPDSPRGESILVPHRESTARPAAHS